MGQIENIVPAIFMLLGLLALGHFIVLLWRRQWTWLGLLIAVGCLFASAAHFAIPFAMLTALDYPANPAETTPITWHYGLGFGVFACVLVILFQAAMHAALSRPRKWSAPVLCIAGSWMMITAGTSFVSHWIETGSLPTVSLNGDLPVWIGFPLLVLLAVAPFACAIPWSLLRHPRPDLSATAQVLARHWLILGTAAMLVAAVGASLVAGVMGAKIGLDDQAERIVTLFVVALVAILSGTLFLALGLQRAFFNPASSIIEGIKNNTSLNAIAADNPLWLPVVASLQSTKTQLDRSRAQLEALFEHVPVPLIVMNLNGDIVLANRASADCYGLNLAEFIGKNSAELMGYWPESDRLRALGTNVANGDGPQRLTTSFDQGTGLDASHYDFLLFPIGDAGGAVAQIGNIAFDVTEQIVAASLIAEQREALHQNEKLAALGQLLAGVSHELNNPLTVLVGRSALLAEKLKDSPHEKAIADLREAADRCSRIVRTFLAMARQEAPRRRAVQINEVIGAAFEMVAYGMHTAGIAVAFELDPTLPDVSADEDQLVQVFTNLLINAQHAMENHTAPRRLHLTTKREMGCVVAIVADSGPGIPPDVASRIFEPFFTTKDVGQGTGMGLAMARGLIEEHGGTLSYKGDTADGAQFEVRLPVGFHESYEAGESQTASEQLLAQPFGLVLVVDDELSIRRLMVEILEADGFECMEATDGCEALALLDAHDFNLIISDIRMPGMDGIELRKRIASEQPAMLERLVFTSGDVLQRDAARYESLIGHKIVDKPFDPSQVRQLLAEMIGHEGTAL